MFNPVVLVTPAIFLAGCMSTNLQNPSFPLDQTTATRALQQMEASPVELKRPVLILGGFLDPGVGPYVLKKKFERLSIDAEILDISLGGTGNLQMCRDRVMDRIESRFPSPGDHETREFDVIGLSMGGLVARLASLEQPDGSRRLKINRLFTVATPHRGAVRASKIPILMELQREMRADSGIIGLLAASPLEYPIYPYSRLGDRVVGVSNAAPPGETPWWLGTKPFQPNHKWAFFDDRIVAELASQLRGDGGFSRLPRQPAPSTIDSHPDVHLPNPDSRQISGGRLNPFEPDR